MYETWHRPSPPDATLKKKKKKLIKDLKENRMMIFVFTLIVPSKKSIHCVEDAFNVGMFYKLKVSFNMGRFSDS